MSSKVLVTGSSGFLGKSVCTELSVHGYEVVPYDISEGCDILDADQFRSRLLGCDACVHLAAVADLYIADQNQSLCRIINIDGTKIVAQTCFESGVKILYASTCCAYGNNGMDVSDEMSKTAPTELYAETKLLGESIVKHSGAEYSILRLATFYGPEMRTSLATHVFLSKAIRNEIIQVHGNGNQTRCYTHVDDIVSGIRILLQTEHPPKLINVACEEEVSVNELLDIVRTITGESISTEYVHDREGQILHQRISSKRLQSLGWSPKYNMESGMKQCYATWRAQLEDLKN